MDMAFLVQMRQSNKCPGVKNDAIINLHLGSGSTSHASCQAPSRICWFHLPKQSTREKTKNPEIRHNFQQIALPCPNYTELRAEKEVNLGPSPKKGSDKTNMYKQERNIQKKASCIEQPGSHMDPSTQKGRLEIQCKEKNQ